MIALGHNPHRPNIKAVSHICLAVIACWFLQTEPTNGQELSSETSAYLQPLDEQQKELHRIDDALKAGIQQIERACKPFIEEDSLNKVELKPNTYLQLNQARASIEAKSNDVLLQFKNVQNVASIKEVEVCNSATSAQATDSCLSLKFAIEKLAKSGSLLFKKRQLKIFRFLTTLWWLGSSRPYNALDQILLKISSNHIYNAWMKLTLWTQILSEQPGQLKTEIQNND